MADPVAAVVAVPGKVLSLWQRPIFWVGAAAVVFILFAVVLYVASARSWMMAKLTARAITAGEAAPADVTADEPVQPQAVTSSLVP